MYPFFCILQFNELKISRKYSTKTEIWTVHIIDLRKGYSSLMVLLRERYDSV